MNKIVKWFLISIGIIFLIIISCFLLMLYSFSRIFDDMEFYTKQDLIENYELKHNEINNLYYYINSIVDRDKFVSVEFGNDDNNLEIFHVNVDSIHNSNWDINIKSEKADSLLNKLGWTNETLKTLKQKLDSANCISISSGEPVTIGFKRSGMGMYFYKIFDQSLNDSLQSIYNDGCTYIFYKDNVVLEYGGGAIGPQCFPK